MDKILITGGSGFIGQHLIPELLGRGWQVEVLSRDADKAAGVLPQAVRIIESLSEASEPNAIINLAGENLAGKRWTQAQKTEMRQSRLRITRSLIDFIAACQQRPSTLISGSAVGVYGARGDQILTEQAEAGDEFQAHLCLDWEKEAWRAHQEYGVRVCLIRTGIVLDANQGALAQMKTPFKLGLGGHMGSGQQYMSWIHRRDEINAILFLLDNSQCQGPYNLTAPEPVTNRQFTDQLAQALSRPSFAWVPGPVLKLMLGEMARLVLTGQRVKPEKLQQAGFQFDFTQLEAALADLL